jgi:hypothetical protein
MTSLTDTQTIILQAASARPDGNIEPLPENINAGIKPRVIQALLNRDLIAPRENGYAINANGFAAIGVPAPTARPTPPPTQPSTTPREGTKQARMIALMRRPGGASIAEICAETGWQKHTVRGTFSNTLKKRLGLDVTSIKDEGQERRYCIGDKPPEINAEPLANEAQ